MSSEQKSLDVVTGGADVRPDPPQIRTHDEIVNYLQRSLEQAMARRAECNVIVPDDTEMTVRLQKRAERKLLVNVGRLMGEASLARSLGAIEPGTHARFHSAALQLLAPTLVGGV